MEASSTAPVPNASFATAPHRFVTHALSLRGRAMGWTTGGVA